MMVCWGAQPTGNVESNVAERVSTSLASKELFEDLLNQAKSILRPYADTNFRLERCKAPGTKLLDKAAKGRLRSVLTAFLEPSCAQVVGLDPTKTVEDYLQPGTTLNLKRPFWFMVAKVCMIHLISLLQSL